MSRKLVFSALACLSVLTAALPAQDIFVLGGQNSASSNVLVFSPTFNQIASFNAGYAPFAVFAKPDGSKFYILANSGSQTVTETDNTFQNPKSLGNLGTQATAGALTPDGKRLLVINGTLHMFDTTTDSDLLAGGILPGVTLTGVAVSLDSTRAFLLGSAPTGQGVVYAMDLTNTSFPIIGNLPLDSTAETIATGPNGLIYVGGVNRVYEINPATIALTPSGEIPTIIRAGALAFTPDGQNLLVANQAPGQNAPEVILINLGSHTVTAQSGSVSNAAFSNLYVVSNSLAYAYSSQTTSLYTLTIPGLGINASTLVGVPPLTVLGASTSSEVPGAGSRTSVQDLYVLSGGAVYKADLPSNQSVGSSPVSTPQASVVVPTLVTASSATPATLLTYGDKQGLAQGATSLPLVVQVLDSNGNPIAGAPVTFATTTPGVTLSNATPTSGAGGYAETTLTAPTTSGAVVVTATAGPATATFTINVGTTTTTSPTGGLSIVAGQGQLLFQNYNSGIPGFGSPLVVMVTDVNGNPVPNASVTYEITQGFGTLLGGTPTPDNMGTILLTGSNGQASAAFLSTQIPPYTGYAQTTVQVSAPGTNSETFYVTTASSNPEPTANFLSPQPGTVYTGASGTTIKGAIQIAVGSVLGSNIANVNLRLVDPATWNGDPTSAPNSTYAHCNDPTGNGLLTDATGKATCDLVLTGPIGTASVIPVVGYRFAGQPVILHITAGAPSVVQIVSGNTQSGTPGSSLSNAFSVLVTDSAGNILSGVPVNFQVVTPGTITLANVSTSTDTNGRASALGTLGNVAGTYMVKVTAGTGTANFSFTVNVAAASLTPVSGNNQTAVISSAFANPVTVQVSDANGNPVAGVPVTFGVSSGSATLSAPSATTSANGQASTTVTAGSGAGTITIAVTAGTLSTSFTLTSILPGPQNVTFVNGASFQPGIAPGSIAVIMGAGLLPGVTGVVQPLNIVGPLPTSLAGFSVTFNGVQAPIFYVSNQNGQQQVSVQVPFEISAGPATVVINAPGGGTATLTNVPVQAVAPALFQTQYNGQNYAVITRPDGSYVSPTNPARLGETDCAYATGLGQTSPALSTNSAGVANQMLVDPIAFGLNNAGVNVVSALAVPGEVGVYQICFQVPSNTATGAMQNVGLIVNDPSGQFYGQNTYIPIQ